MPQITAHSRRPFDRSILTICFFLSISVIYKMSLYSLVHRFCHRDPDNISQANKKDGYRKEDKQVGTRGDSNTKGET